jgi:hypothetical protein
MSISLTDDNIRWINNHPITRNNIKDQISDIMKQTKSNYNTFSKLEVSSLITDKIDNLKSSFESNFNMKLNKIENNIDRLDNKFNNKFDKINDKIKSVDEIQREIDNAFTNRIISNDEYKHIYADNLEKLKLSLEQKGNQIMTSIINESAYQNIADIHLETLSKRLENKYDEHLTKTSVDTKNMLKKINDMKSELTYYKHKLESLESLILNGIFIMSCLILGIGFVKLFSYGNIQSNPAQIIQPVIERLDTMGSPVLRIT